MERSLHVDVNFDRANDDTGFKISEIVIIAAGDNRRAKNNKTQKDYKIEAYQNRPDRQGS